jgi:hypothetical protein
MILHIIYLRQPPPLHAERRLLLVFSHFFIEVLLYGAVTSSVFYVSYKIRGKENKEINYRKGTGYLIFDWEYDKAQKKERRVDVS